MTFAEARLSLQLLAEVEVGAPLYEQAVTARAREDAAFGAAIPKTDPA